MIRNKLSKPWNVQWQTSSPVAWMRADWPAGTTWQMLMSYRIALDKGGFWTEKTYCRGGYTAVWAVNKTQAKQQFRQQFRTEPREKIEILGVHDHQRCVAFRAMGPGTGHGAY